MSLRTDVQTIEAEKLIGTRRAQVLVRAEGLVPGAGRDAIEPLLADANLFIGTADVQADRVVIEGSIDCQAVYRQGEQTTLSALAARATLSHVLEIAGAQPEMLCRVKGRVSHVDARYENGHMIFQVTCNLSAQVLQLTPEQVVTGAEGVAGLETAARPLSSVKLAAEAEEHALLSDVVALPAALDARTTLMDWATVEVDETAPDLGGVRVKGRAIVETLVSSGAEGRPAVLVRYQLPLDQLVELPDWLAGDTRAEVDVQALETRVEPGDDAGDMRLICEMQLRVRVLANATDSAEAIADAYATGETGLRTEMQTLDLCSEAEYVRISEIVRGTVLIGENAPGVGTVIAAQVQPSIGEWRAEEGHGIIEGVIETRVLYMPGGSDLPASAEAELPFSLRVPQELNEQSMIDIRVLSAEANALMSDRLEMKLQLSVACETRRRQRVETVLEISEADPVKRRPGIVVTWPESGESAWEIGKRYGVSPEAIGEIEAGKPVVIKV